MLINLKRNVQILDDTPLDVIVYFLKTLSKNIEKEKVESKLEKINKFVESYNETIDLDSNFTNSYYEKISKFVSITEEPWKIETLMRSFQDLINFERELNFKELDVGIRTNTNPFKLDIIMLYQICKKMEIKTSREDTILTLKEKVESIKIDRAELLEEIKDKILDCSDLQLLNITNFLNLHKKEKDFDKEKLKSLTSNINMNYIIARSLLTLEEAVVYGAKFFSLDLSFCKNPSKVLKSLNLEKETDEDSVFWKNYKLNKNYYKMDRFWKKHIDYLYTPKLLTAIKKYEAIVDSDEDTTELDLKLNKNNFYHGRIPGVHDFFTDENVISYGVFSDKNLRTIDLENLYLLFKTECSFGEYSNEINKLLIICKELEGDIYEKLFDTILFIKKFGLVLEKNMKQIKNIEVFEKLHELSLLFSEKEKIDDLDNLSILNSSEEIKNILEKDQYLREIPLVFYKNSKFVKAKDNYYSTLYEDIKSLRDLQNKPTEYIKSKRDYYKYTSYFYLYIITEKEPFTLE